MAFGFGFNKQKVLSAAEKFVQQGKLQNAIAEYDKILKADPKDLTVMNTVGDLYSRLGDNDKAVECFKNVGDAYAAQGFTVKAIAMYKKLSKSKPSVESVLRLAELYTQQGLFNDARAQYLQVAEEFLRAGELEQAVRIFQKTLEMDPENVAMRMRLADVYVRLGKKDDARKVYSAAAETLRSKGQLEAAEEVLQKLVNLDPGSSDAVLLRARNAMETGDFASAAQQLEKVKNIESNPEALRGLFHSYLHLGKLSEAGALAPKLFATQEDASSIREYVDTLIATGQHEEALPVYKTYSDRLIDADSTKFLNGVHALIGPLSENAASLESILELLDRAGDKSHDAEIYELLAHAYVQSGQLEKARDCYTSLIQLEPQNQLHAQSYQQVMGRLGGASSTPMITVEEGAVLVDEMEATAPFIEQTYDDDVALALRAAMTDADLFLSYNIPEKALAPLLAVLPQAPRDLKLNQRMAALHTRAGRFAEAAVCCRTLESLYHDASHPGEASGYGELASKYEARGAAGASQPVILAPPVSEVSEAAIEIPEMEVEVAPVPAEEPKAAFEEALVEIEQPAEFAVQSAPSPSEQEIDLSNEWEAGETIAAPPQEVAEIAPAQPAAADDLAVAETIEEIRFYLEHSMAEQAHTAFAKLEQLTSDAAMLGALRVEIETAAAKAPVVEAEAVVESDSLEPETIETAMVETEPVVEQALEEAPIVLDEPAPVVEAAEAFPAVPEEVSVPIMQEQSAEASPKQKPGVLNELVTDLESSLGADFLPAVSPQKTTAPPVPTPVAATIPPVPASAGVLGELVSDLEASLGNDFLPGASAAQTRQVSAKSDPVPAASIAASAPIALSAAASASASSTSTPQSSAGPIAQPSSATAPDPSAGIDLAGMFGELRHELEEDAAVADEDPETHYNLGVAFREMGLLDEAIGELQKVCQAHEHGHPFPQMMQAYTWLAQCFLDKGVPEAAVRWYERALRMPQLDGETRTALHYELGSALEAAGNKSAALNHFTEVYGSNIDYRDVAERIKALKS